MADDGPALRSVGEVNPSQWANMQDVFYAQTTQYVLPWSVTSLAATRVAHAPLGGLFALVRDQSVLAPVLPGQSTRMQISIYTSAGQLVESLPWDANHQIAAIAFTLTEVLVVVRADGVVRLYHLFTPAPLYAEYVTESDDADPVGNNSDPVSAGVRDFGDGASAEPKSIHPVTSKATQYTYLVSYSLASLWAGDNSIVDARLHEASHTLIFLTRSGAFYAWRLPEDATKDALRDADASASGIGESGSNHRFFNSAWVYPSWPRFDPDQGSSSATEGTISSWAIAPNPAGHDHPPDVLISPSWSSSLFRLPGSQSQSADSSAAYAQPSTGGCEDLRLADGPYRAISTSPDGSLLSLLRNDWTVEVLTSDLARGLSDFDLSPLLTLDQPDQNLPDLWGAQLALQQAGISQFEWCGNMAVALVLEATSQILLVGPFGETASFPFSAHLQPRIFTEADGLCVLSSDRLDVLAMVDEGTCHIFLPGSTHPGALLYESSELFYGPEAPTNNDINHDAPARFEAEASATARVRRKTKADASIRAIQLTLPEAVQTCLLAASHAWPASLQKRLLRAAELGQTFIDPSRVGTFSSRDREGSDEIPGHDATALLSVSKQLRILNSLRRPDVALALTWEQWRHPLAGVRGTMARLAARRMHRLAVSLARLQHNQTDTSRLIAATAQHWARCMIAATPAAGGSAATAAALTSAGASGRSSGPTSSPADLSLAETIASRFTAEKVGSSAPFADLARLAGQLGRLGLARALVRREPKVVAQVSLLLDMADVKGALKVASYAGDPDLVQHVLRQVFQATSVAGLLAVTLTSGDVGIRPFFSNVQPLPESSDSAGPADSSSVQSTRLPVASALLEAFAQAEYPDMLRDLFFQDDRRVSMALLLFQEAYQVPLSNTGTETVRAEALGERIEFLEQAKASFQEDRDRQTEARITDSANKLLTVQAALERELRSESVNTIPTLVGRSVRDTMAILFVRQDTARAERVGSTMGVPARRTARIAIDAFTAQRDWAGLAQWALHSRRPPACGLTPVIITLLRHRQTDDLLTLVDAAPDRERDGLMTALQRMPPPFSEAVEQLLARIEERM